MKHISVLTFLLAFLVFAQIPRTMNYQGKLTDPTGVAIEGIDTIAFDIYDVSIGGSSLWSETLSVNITKGLFDVMLGEIHPISPNFAVPYWMELSVSNDGGITFETLSPRTKLAPVGYAYRAIWADSVIASIADSDWARSGNLIYTFNIGDSVGIGINSPVQKLDIDGSVNIRGGLIQNTTTSANMDFVTTNGKFRFFQDGGTGTNPRMIINSQGAYIYNQTGPAMLRLIGHSDGYTFSGIALYRDTFYTDSPAVDSCWFISSNVGNNFNIDWWAASSGGVQLTIAPSGNVGIGTASPGWLLEVNGSAAKPGGGSWTNSSDIRLKDIHYNFNRGLNALMTLQPVAYNYKMNNPLGLPSQNTYIGLIAQDVEEVIPEAIEKSNKNDYLYLNNDPIIWTMLNAIKELSTQIDELRGIIKKQQAEIDSLKKR